jgi:Rieske Fe-S protein
MERRRFLGSCVAAASGAAGITVAAAAWAEAAPRLYGRALLVDPKGEPIRAAASLPKQHLFHYPYAATPCFLLNLGRSIVAPATLRREDGTSYAWQGGVGPTRAIVAFSQSARKPVSPLCLRSSATSRRNQTSDAR